MGIAAYNRDSAAIRRGFNAQQRPVEFERMVRLIEEDHARNVRRLTRRAQTATSRQ